MCVIVKARSDPFLVDKCLKGNKRAFEALVDKYRTPVYNLALRMLKNSEDASDITQTVFAKAYEKLESYDPKHRFFSWIYRIAINESISFSNKQKSVEEYESGVTAINKLTPEDNYKTGDSPPSRPQPQAAPRYEPSEVLERTFGRVHDRRF